MFHRLANHRVWGPAGLLVMALLLLAFKLAGFGGVADAQHHDAKKGVKNPTTSTARYINQVLASGTADSIKEVYAFPTYSSIFLVRTDRAVTVWERRDDSIKSLLDIKLDGSFEKLVFLEDGSTFIIQTSRAANVYAVESDLVTVLPVDKKTTAAHKTEKN
jgi:hypothetical protein